MFGNKKEKITGQTRVVTYKGRTADNNGDWYLTFTTICDDGQPNRNDDLRAWLNFNTSYGHRLWQATIGGNMTSCKQAPKNSPIY